MKIFLGLIFALALSAQGQVNIWTNTPGGKWEAADNWSAGSPRTNHTANFITNATTKTVTVDANTVAVNPLNPILTISNLTVSGPAGTVNTLQLTNAGAVTPLRILSSLTVSNGGAVLVSNSWLQVDGLSSGVFGINGGVTVLGGGVVSGAVAQIRLGTFSGGAGTLNIGGGTLTTAGTLSLGHVAGSTGTLWMTGGQLVVTNSPFGMVVGNLGVGQLTVSNGNWLAPSVLIANNAGSQGTLNIAGGTHEFAGDFSVAASSGTGTVWLTGGQLTMTNGNATVAGTGGIGQMTVSNGTWRPQAVTVGFSIGSKGTLTIAGGTTLISPFSLTVGNVGDSTGTVWVTGGQLVVTNTPANIGSGAVGQMTVSNGLFLAGTLRVGNSAGALGTLTIAGGTNQITGSTAIGLSVVSTGTVWITGGVMEATNGFVFVVGSGGSGQLILSNGVLRRGLISIAGTGGSVGTLTVAGGTLEGPAAIQAGNAFGVTGTVWVTGGTVVLTNNSFANALGNGGRGFMTISNGVVTANSFSIGLGPLAVGVGTLTVAGGTNSLYSGMTLGNFNCTATGIVVVSGGRLFVTNATGTAVLDVRSGTVTLDSGTLTIDNLVITNACGRFIQSGGTLMIGTNILAAALDADGDGIPNFADPGPFNPTDTGDDPDGDGQTNLEEFLAGTNPTNSASFLGITAIAREGNDIRVTWMTAAGKTNALERTAGVAGSFTNNFTGLTNIITAGTTTNVLDLGAATNAPAFYYRVRLVP